MSILIDEKTRVLVQGITGRDGSFHTKAMLEYGTRVVAGVTPGKGGQKVCDVPVFNTVKEAAEATGANCSAVSAILNSAFRRRQLTEAGMPPNAQAEEQIGGPSVPGEFVWFALRLRSGRPGAAYLSLRFRSSLACESGEAGLAKTESTF